MPPATLGSAPELSLGDARATFSRLCTGHGTKLSEVEGQRQGPPWWALMEGGGGMSRGHRASPKEAASRGPQGGRTSCPRWRWGSQPWPPVEAPAALPPLSRTLPTPQGPPIHSGLQPLLQDIRCPGVNSTLLRGFTRRECWSGAPREEGPDPDSMRRRKEARPRSWEGGHRPSPPPQGTPHCGPRRGLCTRMTQCIGLSSGTRFL